MTHKSGHVVISFSTPLDSEKPDGFKAWHCLAAALVVGFVLGALIF